MSEHFLISHCPKILARGRMRRQNKREKWKKNSGNGKGCMLLWAAESPVDHCFCCADCKCKWCDSQNRKAASDVSRFCYRLCECEKDTNLPACLSRSFFHQFSMLACCFCRFLCVNMCVLSPYGWAANGCDVCPIGVRQQFNPAGRALLFFRLNNIINNN